MYWKRLGMLLKPGQRDLARAITASCPEGSLGRDAIYPHLSCWAVKYLARNIGAGRVGDFYKKYEHLLRQPATDENIRHWSDLEREFFGTQDRVTQFFASLLPGDARERWMKFARDLSARLRLENGQDK